MFKKILKLFKKGAKAVPKGKDQAAVGGGFEWPSGMRIGVFGHTNSGKTVYFTVLNEECKVSKNLGLSVTDNITAGEFLANYRALWGLGSSCLPPEHPRRRTGSPTSRTCRHRPCRS